MVTIAALRHWIIIITLSTIFFTYLILINICIKESLRKSRRSYPFGVKKIVAFSLMKRIEIDSEQYNCDQNIENYRDHKAEDNDENHKRSVDDVIVMENKRSTRRNEKDDHLDDDDDGSSFDSDGSAWTTIIVTADGSSRSSSSHLYVYSAYLDKRLDPYHYIRIIAAVKGRLDSSTYFCQVLTQNNYYVYLRATILPIWANNWDKNDTSIYLNPILISCQLPLENFQNAVSLTSTPCQKPEIRRPVFQIVSGSLWKKRLVTVCVKPLDFVEDISQRLIQWIEVIRFLGAERIEFYVKKIPLKAWNVLKWYVTTFPGKVMMKNFNVPPSSSTFIDGNNRTFSEKLWQKRKLEIIAYNDCFYNNIHSSNFVVPLDIDEIIIPRKATTWKHFLKVMLATYPKLKSFASLTVSNTYYFGKTSSLKNYSLFYFENLQRSDYSPTGESGKSFISTEHSLTVFNHYALNTLRPGIGKAYFLPTSFIQMNHYKESCNTVILPECTKYLTSPTILDPVMLKLKTKLTYRYNRTLRKLETIL